jgi:hypothetical protein
MGEARTALEELYGLTGDERCDKNGLFITLTAHLGYLFGWSEGDTAECLKTLVPTAESSNEWTSSAVSQIWSRLAMTPLRHRAGLNPTPQTVACDLVIHWLALAKQRGIDLEALSPVVTRSLNHALFGIDYEVVEGEPRRRGDLPSELFDLLKGPLVFYMDVIAGMSRESKHDTSWRQSLPATMHARMIMHAHGLLPTLEMYLTEAELEPFRNIAWREDELFLSVFQRREELEFGFAWKIEDDLLVCTAPVSGAHGRYALATAMIFGLVRIDVFNVSLPSMPHQFSRTVYVSAAQSRAFFDTDDINSAVNNAILAPTSEEFLSIDESRHIGVIASSHLLRQSSTAMFKDLSGVEEYDQQIDTWRYSRRLNSAPSPRPPAPPILEEVASPSGRPGDYLGDSEIFVHIEYDGHRGEIGFVWVDASDTYVEHYETVDGRFDSALVEHLDHRQQGELRGDTPVISDRGEETLRILIGMLEQPFRGWFSVLGDKPSRIWYSTGRQLTGVPLHFLLGVVSVTECVRSPSLFISALVDEATEREETSQYRLLDVFDCSAGESRIDFASKECQAIQDCYGYSLSKHSSDDFQCSEADVIHVSAHGKGFGEAADNMLLLGSSGDEVVDVIDILRAPGALRADLIFLDVCSVGSVNNATTALHEGVSVADALLLRGARYVVAAEWPIGDYYGALYSVAFHFANTQNHSVPASLHIVRAYFQGTLQYPEMERLLDDILERTFGDWRKRSGQLRSKPDDVGYLAAFEVHGRPVRKRGVAKTPVGQRGEVFAAAERRLAPYSAARRLRDSW